MARAIAVRAGIRARKIPAHRRAGFVDRAVALLGEMLAGEKFLAAKNPERDYHLGDGFDLRDGGGLAFFPALEFFFYKCVRMLE